MAVATANGRRTGDRRGSRWLLATVAVAFLAYRPVLGLAFAGDDFIILHLLRQAGGLQHPGTYFHLNFFGYYRPVAFLSQAFDWQLWHGQAIGFHLTSLLLHTANGVLVFVFARRLLGVVPAVVAALLFALHPSSHEAVFWMSSRFDLLATFLMLLGLLAVQADAPPRNGPEPMPTRSIVLSGASVACFALALLSKESAFAFPAIAAGYDVFVARRSGRATLLRLLPLLAIVALYSGIRVAAGGPELGQGLARAAKVVLLGGGLAALVWLAFSRADALLDGLAQSRRLLVGALAFGLATSLVGSLLPATSAIVRPKLAFASFAAFYLLSPVVTLGGSPPPTFEASQTLYWATGLLALAAAGALFVLVWRRDTGWSGAGRPHNAIVAFLFVFVAAALLPVSSMTEGKRYLYVASIGVSLMAGYAVGRTRTAGRWIAVALVAIVLAVSGWQIQLKAEDWRWAGTMTGETVRLVRQSDPDACRGRNILFLTAPVNVRDVYCNFYDYTFEDAGTACHPETVRAVVRVVGRDVSVSAEWTGERTVMMRVHGVTDRLIASRDLRHFDVPLWPAAPRSLATSIGVLMTAPIENGQALQIRFADTFDPRRWRVLYYSAGGVRELAMPDAQPAQVVGLQNWK